MRDHRSQPRCYSDQKFKDLQFAVSLSYSNRSRWGEILPTVFPITSERRRLYSRLSNSYASLFSFDWISLESQS